MPQSSNFKRFKKLTGYVLAGIMILEGVIFPVNSVLADEIISDYKEEIIEEEAPDTINERESEIICEEEIPEAVDETEIDEEFDQEVEIEASDKLSAGPAVNITISGDTAIVSGTGPMQNYTSTTVPWNPSKNSIKKVIIEDGVTVIGTNAFDSCNNLEYVSIAPTVQYISNSAFSWCPKLVELKMPLSAEISESAFFHSNKLNKLTIVSSNSVINYTENTSTKTPWYQSVEGTVTVNIDPNLEEIGNYTFYNGGAKYSFGELKLNNVKNIGDFAFSKCDGINKITLDNSTQPVNIGQAAFMGCKNVTQLSLPISLSLNKANPFKDMSALTDIKVTTGTSKGTDYTFATYKNTPWYSADKDLNMTFTSGIESVGNMTFYNCSKLTNIALPSATVKEIGSRAFSGCSSLVTFNMPAGVTEIKDQTFQDCVSLTGKFTSLPSAITYFGRDAFKGCIALENVKIPDSLTYMYRNTFYGCSNLLYSNLSYENPSKYHRWYTAPDFKTEYNLSQNLIIVSDSFEIYLKNTDDKPVVPTVYYTVRYETNGGSAISSDTISANKGTSVLAKKPVPDPVKYGYNFMGWFEDDECIVPWDFATKYINKDVTIYAKWECAHLEKEIKHIEGRDPGKDPTCYVSGNGIGYEYCKNCNDGPFGGPFVLPAVSHNIVKIITLAPTTTAPGHWVKRCTMCGFIEEEGDLPKLTPEEPLVKLSENKYEISLVPGLSIECKAIVKSSLDKTWLISYDDPKQRVVSISKKGKINGLKAGHTIAHVKRIAKDGSEVEIELDITVKNPVFSKKTYLVEEGDSISLGFGSTGDSTGLKTTYLSSNPRIVQVDAAGTITGVKYGKATITVSIYGKKFATCKVKVHAPKLSAVSLNICDGKAVKLKVKDTSETLTWHSADPKIAKVISGKVFPIKTGATTIYVDVGSKKNALSCFVKVDYPVLSETQKVFVMKSGESPNFKLEVLNSAFADSATWKSSNKSIAEVDTSGKTVTVTTKKAGNAVIYCYVGKIRMTCRVAVYDPYIDGKNTVKLGKRLKLTLKGGDKSDVVWDIESGGTGKASISQKGELLARGRGTVTVLAYTSGVVIRKVITIS